MQLVPRVTSIGRSAARGRQASQLIEGARHKAARRAPRGAECESGALVTDVATFSVARDRRGERVGDAALRPGPRRVAGGAGRTAPTAESMPHQQRRVPASHELPMGAAEQPLPLHVRPRLRRPDRTAEREIGVRKPGEHPLLYTGAPEREYGRQRRGEQQVLARVQQRLRWHRESGGPDLRDGGLGRQQHRHVHRTGQLHVFPVRWRDPRAVHERLRAAHVHLRLPCRLAWAVLRHPGPVQQQPLQRRSDLLPPGTPGRGTVPLRCRLTHAAAPDDTAPASAQPLHGDPLPERRQLHGHRGGDVPLPMHQRFPRDGL